MLAIVDLNQQQTHIFPDTLLLAQTINHYALKTQVEIPSSQQATEPGIMA